MDVIDVLHDVARRLEEIDVPYMLSGSLAVSFYAEPRMTRDIDLVVDAKTDDVERLVAGFQTDYYVSRETVKDAVRRRSLFNLIHNESLVKVDFVIRKNTRYRRVEFKRRRRVRIGNTEIYVVSKEDLIISKITWARESRSEMQRRDVRSLLESGYDEEYLEYWLKELELEQFAEGWLQ